ncbi:MAG TPA: restriction endonuclease subunit S, partial [Enhygromyxa sp.]|nr:restriction endonuclease subunit S [Enhygromyxa sp.]
CVTQAGLDNSSARLLPAGTVCLSRTASVGHVVVMARPMATSQDFANWVCSDAIDPDFLRYLFWAEIESLREFGRGTTHKTIYYPQLEAFHVALPPIDEQRALVVAVESRLARVALLEQAVSSAITAARGLDDAIVASRMRRQPLAQRSS